jgi:hypothetical protein
MTDMEGLILQGCGGDPDDWVKGTNEMLTEAGILLDGDIFKDIYIFEHNGLTNMLFSMEDVKLNIGALAMWRLKTHENFGGTWLSDYLPNRLGVYKGEPGLEEPPPIADDIERQNPCRDGEPGGPRERDNGDSRPSPVFSVEIENIRDSKTGAFTIRLPAALEDLKPVFDSLEISGWQDIKIWGIMSGDDTLHTVVNNCLDKSLPETVLDELNYLAARLQNLSESGRDIFYAAIEKDIGPSEKSVEDLINLTFHENLNCFNLQPAFNEAQYGEFLVQVWLTDKHADAFTRLIQSKDPAYLGLINYIEELEKFTDYRAVGRSYAQKEGGVFTKRGYLTDGESLRKLYYGASNIPSEYRVFTKPGESYKHPIKLENVPAAEAVMMCGAVTLSHMPDAPANLQQLINSPDSDYLLSVSGYGVTLIPAADVYKRGTPNRDKFFAASFTGERKTDARVFSLRLANREDCERKDMAGTFKELNSALFLTHVNKHAIIPDRIDAVLPDGSEKSFDMLEWADLTRERRGSIQAHTPHYADRDIRSIESQYESFLHKSDRVCTAVDMELFLADINERFFAEANYPQPEMLRISNEAARDILARDSVDVFRFTENGAEKLFPIEAVKPMSFAVYHEFAIKLEDAAAMDKWAGRFIQKLLQQNERETRTVEKTKREGL